MGGHARFAFLAIAAALVVLSIAVVASGAPERQSFKAFYCAGRAVDAGADPYRVEPLRACEHRLAGRSLVPGAVEPAPLPGYALALFALLARLPPSLAAYLFALALVAAGALSAVCLTRITGFSTPLILLALSPLLLLNVAYGETPPLALFAICASALFLFQGRFAAAGVAASLALIQPNVALPALLALVIFLPKTRMSIAVSVSVLALISIATLGIDSNLEYVRAVLPLQARSELVASDQYSASRILFELGIPAAQALRLGQVVYAMMVALSLVLASIVARRSFRQEALVLVPPAFALLGGIYLHDIQFIVALPAALFVLSLSRGRTLVATAALAAVLLAIVWTQRPGRGVIMMNVAAVVAVSALSIRTRSVRSVAFVAGIVLIFIAGSMAARAFDRRALTDDLEPPSVAASRSELAPAVWGRYLRSDPDLTQPVYLPKIPTWSALLVLILIAPTASQRRR